MTRKYQNCWAAKWSSEKFHTHSILNWTQKLSGKHYPILQKQRPEMRVGSVSVASQNTWASHHMGSRGTRASVPRCSICALGEEGFLSTTYYFNPPLHSTPSHNTGAFVCLLVCLPACLLVCLLCVCSAHTSKHCIHRIQLGWDWSCGWQPVWVSCPRDDMLRLICQNSQALKF